MQPFEASVFDRLFASGHAPAAAMESSSIHRKRAIASDLEHLLNTRSAASHFLPEIYKQCRTSILGYGLADFSHFSVRNERDRSAVLIAIHRAITSFEPRLKDVEVNYHPARQLEARMAFTISARLSTTQAGETVVFDAFLQPSTRQYQVGYAR